MGGKLRALFLAAACAQVIVPTTARAVDVVYIKGGVSSGILQAQGFNGRIDLPTRIYSSMGPPPIQILGATGNNSTLYTLEVSSGNAVALSDPHTGAYLSQISVSSRLDDIAYTNGQLYGVLHDTSALQIVSIAADGSTQLILNQPETAAGLWRLSGVANGNALLATHFTGIPAPTLGGFVINPTTASVSDLSWNEPSTFAGLNETVINAAGNSVTIVPTLGGPESMVTFPGGAALGNRTAQTAYSDVLSGSNPAISDEFSLAYPSSSPAMSSVTSSVSEPGIDGLIRTPQLLNVTTTISLQNGLAPDSTTLSNLVATSLGLQSSGPTAATFQQNLSGPGDFAAGTVLGQATATLNLATAQRGTYEFTSMPTLTADYAHDSTVDHNRAVTTNETIFASFAYDPPSANLVGNGDASLGRAGWEERHGDTGTWFPGTAGSAAPRGFTLSPAPGNSDAIQQYLQLPTPNGPMLLSFSYFNAFPSSVAADLQVELNGTIIGQVSAGSSTPVEFQALISDPTLENLTNASLMFYSTATGVASVGISNISLIAVPEPAAFSLMAIGAVVVCRRRGRAN